MNRRVIASAIVWALSLGFVVAMFTGGNRVISIEVWLGAFTAFMVLVLFFRLVEAVPMSPATLQVVWRRRKPKSTGWDPRPRELRAIETLVLRARDNERAHSQQLQPRLIALANHYLPMHHGVDPGTDALRTAQILGETAWLIEPTLTTRTPTLDELLSFIDLLTIPPGATPDKVAASSP